MILKIIALGPLGYIRDTYNIIDAFIVIVSLLDFSKYS